MEVRTCCPERAGWDFRSCVGPAWGSWRAGAGGRGLRGSLGQPLPRTMREMLSRGCSSPAAGSNGRSVTGGGLPAVTGTRYSLTGSSVVLPPSPSPHLAAVPPSAAAYRERRQRRCRPAPRPAPSGHRLPPPAGSSRPPFAHGA